MHAPPGGLADRRCDRGGLQPVQRRLEHQVVLEAGAALHKGQDFVRRRRHQARGTQALVPCLHDVAGCPDQHIGIPDGRNAMFRDPLNRQASPHRPRSGWAPPCATWPARRTGRPSGPAHRAGPCHRLAMRGTASAVRVHSKV